MNIQSILTRSCLTLALFVTGAGTGYATSYTCANSGDLSSLLSIDPLTAGHYYTLTGTCFGDNTITISTPGVTLDGQNSTVIEDSIVVAAAGVTLQNFVSGGTSLGGSHVGITVLPGASAIIANTNINTWGGNGIDVFGSLAITGGSGSLVYNNGGSGIYLHPGATASIGYVATNTGLDAQVNITGNTAGVTVDANASALFLLPEIQQNHATGLVVMRSGAAELIGGLVENNQADGIDISDGATVVFNSTDLGAAGTATVVSGNHGAGISMFGGTLDMDKANITGNTNDGLDASVGANVTISSGSITSNFGGGINATHAIVKLRGVTLNGNQGGPPMEAVFSTLDDKTGIYNTPGTLGQPTVLAFRSNVELYGTTLSGPTNSNTIGAFGGSAVMLYNTMISAADSTDATIEAADGSTVTSAGKNLINNSLGGPVMLVTNASTFHQEVNPVFQHAFVPGADTITGTATVQMESNMELGTGAAAPSSWTGNITVQQNSAFRMTGGMTVTGKVQLVQSSNGFFNLNSTGSNVVTKGVSCPVTTAGNMVVSSHAGLTGTNPVVTTGTTSAVTIGTAPPDCGAL